MNILVIDDDEQCLFLMEGLLHKYGCAVTTAQNGMHDLDYHRSQWESDPGFRYDAGRTMV